MPLKYRKKVLLAKVETTYGTDAAPTGAADAMLVSDLSITPLNAEQVKRTTERPYLGSRKAILVGEHVMFEFDVEIAGAGTAGNAAPYGPLLRACAWSETLSVGVDAQYDPIDSNEESATIHFHLDGAKHAALGCRGTVEWRMAAKGIPVLHFSLLALYVAPVAASDPTPTLTSFQDPLPVTNVNTPTVSLHGFAATLQDLTVSQGATAIHRDLPGDESIQITGREASGDITIEAPALGTKDFFAIAKAETLGALQIVHGTTGGNIVQLDAPQVQLLNPAYADQDGITMLKMGLNIVPTSAGDDELKITVK